MDFTVFKSTLLKLSVFYVFVLVVISSFFSYNWYLSATRELRDDIRRQDQILNENPDIFRERGRAVFMSQREQILDESVNQIRDRILLSNILFIFFGSMGSFLLAKKSLLPLENAYSKQKRFIADASHELRTPIAAMKAEIEVALRDKKLTKSEAKDTLRSSLEELNRVNKLASNLLNLSKLDGQSKLIKTENVDLEKLIIDSKDRFVKLAKSKNIKIDLDLTAVQITTDAQKVSDLLNILVDNAIKYSPAKTTVTIGLKLTSAGGLISVSDQGYGISPSNQERIFERFYRVDQARNQEKSEGFGLGLTIAKELSVNLDANLSVKSSPGNGSTFSFEVKNIS